MYSKSCLFFSSCQASCVAVSAAISMMLTREEKYVKKSGNYDIDTVIDDAFTYASRSMLGLYSEVSCMLLVCLHPST